MDDKNKDVRFVVILYNNATLENVTHRIKQMSNRLEIYEHPERKELRGATSILEYERLFNTNLSYKNNILYETNPAKIPKTLNDSVVDITLEI